MVEYTSEYHSFIETFTSWEDAILWAEHRIKPYDPSEWGIEVDIKTINNKYRVGVSAYSNQIPLPLEHEPREEE